MPERGGWVTADPLSIAYHDEEWGVPAHDDRHLIEMLILEGAQAVPCPESSGSGPAAAESEKVVSAMAARSASGGMKGLLVRGVRWKVMRREKKRMRSSLFLPFSPSPCEISIRLSRPAAP